MEMGDRFPDVDWYCDECHECLNDQPGFSDQNDRWNCSGCGYGNNISAEEILSDEDVAQAIDFLTNFDPAKFSD